jgi:hypothetical protein
MRVSLDTFYLLTTSHFAQVPLQLMSFLNKEFRLFCRSAYSHNGLGISIKTWLPSETQILTQHQSISKLTLVLSILRTQQCIPPFSPARFRLVSS